MNIRRIFIFPAALVFALAAGYSLLWLFAAQRIEEGFRDWARMQGTQGVAVDYGALAVSGFPAVVRLAIPEPRFASTRDSWQWSAAHADLEMRAWNWWVYRLDIFGEQRIALPVNGTIQQLSARADTAFVVAEADGRGRVSKAVLHAAGLRLGDAAGGELLSAATVQGTTGMPDRKAIAQDRTALDLTLRATDVQLGPAVESPLGPRIEALSIAATVRGALPGTLTRDDVDAWRRDGGTIDLNQFHLTWAALDLRATGTMALDERMRPLGALSAEIRGYGETLIALEQARVLPRQTVAGSRLALDLLSRRDEVDGRRVVTMPLSAQGGAVFLGPIRMVGLDPIPFPAR